MIVLVVTWQCGSDVRLIHFVLDLRDTAVQCTNDVSLRVLASQAGRVSRPFAPTGRFWCLPQWTPRAQWGPYSCTVSRCVATHIDSVYYVNPSIKSGCQAALCVDWFGCLWIFLRRAAGFECGVVTALFTSTCG